MTNTRAKRAAARQNAINTNPLSVITQQYMGQIPTAAVARAQAIKSVNDAIAAGKIDIQQAYADQQDALRKQQERTAGFAQALAHLEQNDPANVLADYRSATDRMAGLSNGLSGAVADAQQAQIDKSKADIAAFTGDSSNVGGYDPAAIRNAVSMTNVVNPGTSMESQALAAAAQAESDRRNSAAGLQAQSVGFGHQLDDITNQIKSQTLALLAKRPDMINQAIQSAESTRNQGMATLLQALALGGTLSNQQSQINARNAGVTGTTSTGATAGGWWKNPITGTREKLGNSTILKVNGKQVRVPVGWTVVHKKDGDHLVSPSGKVAGSTTSTASASLTARQIKDAKADIVKAVGATGVYAKDITDPYEESKHYANPVYKPTMSYAAAKAKLLARLPKTLQSNPQVLAAIDQALTQYGYKVPSSSTPRRTPAKPPPKGI